MVLPLLVQGAVGQVLFVGCLAAWGTLASSLFNHQMVAYFLAFLWFMFLFIVGALERYLPGLLGVITHEFSLLYHFERFSRGVADTRDLLYFVLMTAVPLFAATAVVGGRRLPARRRFTQWIPTLLTAILAVVVDILGQTWVGAWDLTGNKRYSLAPQTLQVLDALPENLARREMFGEKNTAAGGRNAGTLQVEGGLGLLHQALPCKDLHRFQSIGTLRSKCS